MSLFNQIDIDHKNVYYGHSRTKITLIRFMYYCNASKLKLS